MSEMLRDQTILLTFVESHAMTAGGLLLFLAQWIFNSGDH